MEENEIITNQEAQAVQQNETQNYLYVQSKAYVKEAGKWMHFMAIILAIGIGLLAIGGICMMLFSSFFAMYDTEEMPAFVFVIMGFVYIAMAVILVFPTIYLFRASNAAAKAVALENNEQLVEFFKNNKSYWKFQGIYTIVCLSLCALLIVAAIIIGIVAAATL